MKKVGRKRLLTEEERVQLCEDYARYERIMRRYQRLLKPFSPKALARRYNISAPTVIDYGRGRHKNRANYGLPSVAQREAELA